MQMEFTEIQTEEVVDKDVATEQTTQVVEKEEPKDPSGYWKNYNEFLVNLA